jgi:hypothetical protein
VEGTYVCRAEDILRYEELISVYDQVDAGFETSKVLARE